MPNATNTSKYAIEVVEGYISLFETIFNKNQDLVKFFHFGIPHPQFDDENDAVKKELASLTEILQEFKSNPNEKRNRLQKHLQKHDLPRMIFRAIDSSRKLNAHFLQNASKINNANEISNCKAVAMANMQSLEQSNQKAMEMDPKLKEIIIRKTQKKNVKKKSQSKQVDLNLHAKHNFEQSTLNDNSDKLTSSIGNVGNKLDKNIHEENSNNQSNLGSADASFINTPQIPYVNQQPAQLTPKITPSLKKTKRVPKKSKKLLQNEESDEEYLDHAQDLESSTSTKERAYRKKNTRRKNSRVRISTGESNQELDSLSGKKKTNSKIKNTLKKAAEDNIHLPVEKVKAIGRKRRRDSSAFTSTDSLNEPDCNNSPSTEKTKKETKDIKSKDLNCRESEPQPLSFEEQLKKKEEENLSIKRKKYLDKLKDHYPKRLTNPLLCLPPFPSTPNPTIDLIPNGAEIWNLMDIYFPKPGSFPLSTVASILGFDVTPRRDSKIAVGMGQEYDPNEVPLRTFKRGSDGKPEDPFQMIPPLGKFAQIWRTRRKEKLLAKDEIYDGDDALDFIDVSWSKILAQFRGVKSIKDLKLATDMAHLPNYQLPLDCIKLARECKLITDDIKFRYAQMGDENSLLEYVNANDEIDFQTSQELIAIFKSESQKIIVAEKDDGKIVCFLHYSFNWYVLNEERQQKGKNILKEGASQPTKSNDKRKAQKGTPELVTVIHQIGDSTNRNGKNLNVILVLISLAIHHAQQSNVFYGIMDVPDSMAKFYAQLFRMRILPKAAESKLVPLACDMVMISYQYTFYMKLEIDRKNFPCNSNEKELLQEVISERMIIRLPNIEEAQSHLEENGGCKPNLVDQPQPSVNHSIHKIRNKHVRIILERKNKPNLDNAESSDIENFQPKSTENSSLVITSSIYDQEKSNDEVSKNVIQIFNDDKVAKCPTWKVLRVFPAQSTTGNHKNGRNNLSFYENGSLLDKLKELQRKMVETEKNLEPELRKIFLNIVKEEEKNASNEYKTSLEEEKRAKIEYSSVLKRRQEAQLAWEAQLEQDMDAVCDVCCDGEITPDNQILFCEACNVAVHQKCYGIDTIPDGDYFCKACRYFNRDKNEQAMTNDKYSFANNPVPRSAPVPLPISCELCPRKQGAFVRTEVKQKAVLQKRTMKSIPTIVKWVHVVCAKWQGLVYVDHPVCEMIEDVQPMKQQYQQLGSECMLCKSKRGAFFRCSMQDCTNSLHVTCARSSGLCKINHGDCYDGSVVENPWKLYCPDHSEIEKPEEGSMSIEQLILAAKAFPPEEKPPPPPKPFWKMSGKERKTYFNDELNEELFFEMIMDRIEGLRCNICNIADHNPDSRKTKDSKNKHKVKNKRTCLDQESYENSLSVCTDCGLVAHIGCYSNSVTDKGKQFLCDSCKYTKEHKDDEDFEEPRCHMCNQKSGLLIKAFAIPASKKKWQGKPNKLKKTLFGKQIWCHSVCGMWHPNCMYQNHFHADRIDSVDCTNIIMADGKRHTSWGYPCLLCGRSDKAKTYCADPGCQYIQNKKNKRQGHFHITCARQAGLEVSDDDDAKTDKDIFFKLHCYRHSKMEFSLQGKLKNMLDFEKTRSGQNFESMNSPMSIAHATSLINLSVTIMGVLGWSWRWADWWVQYGHKNLTKIEESMDVHDEDKSTAESRCRDARKCRLAAFGAALRNRDYDEEENDNKIALDSALRAILSTPSLVGALKKIEIDFLSEWLGRAYRYASPLLGFGKDAIPVAEDGICLHVDDKSKKYELGDRPLPGKQKQTNKKTLFEEVEEVDDFLKPNTWLEPMQDPIKNTSKDPGEDQVKDTVGDPAKNPVSKKKSTNDPPNDPNKNPNHDPNNNSTLIPPNPSPPQPSHSQDETLPRRKIKKKGNGISQIEEKHRHRFLDESPQKHTNKRHLSQPKLNSSSSSKGGKPNMFEKNISTKRRRSNPAKARQLPIKKVKKKKLETIEKNHSPMTKTSMIPKPPSTIAVKEKEITSASFFDFKIAKKKRTKPS